MAHNPHLEKAIQMTQCLGTKALALEEHCRQKAEASPQTQPLGRAALRAALTVDIHQGPSTCWHCAGSWQVVIPVRQMQAGGEGKQVNKWVENSIIEECVPVKGRWKTTNWCWGGGRC